MTAILALTGSLTLGWTWARPDGRSPGVGTVAAGKVLLTLSFDAYRNLGRCIENPWLPQEQIDDALADLGMLVGVLLVALGGWVFRRRSA